MLWQVYERRIAKSDFPQFPDGARSKEFSSSSIVTDKKW